MRSALDLDPSFPFAYFWLTRLYTNEKRFEEAEVASTRAAKLARWTPMMAARGVLYGAWGKPEKAREVLAEFDEPLRTRPPGSASDLQRDVSAKPGIVRAVDLTHAPGTQQSPRRVPESSAMVERAF